MCLISAGKPGTTVAVPATAAVMIAPESLDGTAQQCVCRAPIPRNGNGLVLMKYGVRVREIGSDIGLRRITKYRKDLSLYLFSKSANAIRSVSTDFNFGSVPATCPPTIATANDGGVLTVLSLGMFPASTVTASII